MLNKKRLCFEMLSRHITREGPVQIRGWPDFWWNFKTFISKLHNLFPSQNSLCYHVLKGNYPNKFLNRSKTSAFRTTIDSGAKNSVGGVV